MSAFQKFLTECTSYKEKVLRHYDNYLLEYTPGDPRCVSWMDGRNNQIARFKELTKIDIQESDVLLDWGCGTGDLYEYLNENDIKCNYCGLDINEKYVKMAKRRFPECIWLKGNIEDIEEESCDWICASGIFNVGYHLNEVVDLVCTATTKCRKGISFNCLRESCDFVTGFNPTNLCLRIFEQTGLKPILNESGYTTDSNDYTVIISLQ